MSTALAALFYSEDSMNKIMSRDAAMREFCSSNRLPIGPVKALLAAHTIVWVKNDYRVAIGIDSIEESAILRICNTAVGSNYSGSGRMGRYFHGYFSAFGEGSEVAVQMKTDAGYLRTLWR